MLWRRGKAYGQDLRERVFAAFDAGVPVGQVAAMLLVSVSYVSKVLSRRRLTGETTARPQRCHVPRKLTAHEAQIRTQMAARPDATLAELQAWLLGTHQVRASSALLSSTLRRLGLTLKKDLACRRTRPSRCRAGTPGLARWPAQVGCPGADLH